MLATIVRTMKKLVYRSNRYWLRFEASLHVAVSKFARKPERACMSWYRNVCLTRVELARFDIRLGGWREIAVHVVISIIAFK